MNSGWDLASENTNSFCTATPLQDVIRLNCYFYLTSLGWTIDEADVWRGGRGLLPNGDEFEYDNLVELAKFFGYDERRHPSLRITEYGFRSL